MPDQKIFVIGEEETVLMLGLLGIEGMVLENDNEFLPLFNELVIKPSIGMIIIAYNLTEEQFQSVIAYKVNNIRPFIYYLPEIFGEGDERQDVFTQFKITQTSPRKRQG